MNHPSVGVIKRKAIGVAAQHARYIAAEEDAAEAEEALVAECLRVAEVALPALVSRFPATSAIPMVWHPGEYVRLAQTDDGDPESDLLWRLDGVLVVRDRMRSAAGGWTSTLSEAISVAQACVWFDPQDIIERIRAMLDAQLGGAKPRTTLALAGNAERFERALDAFREEGKSPVANLERVEKALDVLETPEDLFRAAAIARVEVKARQVNKHAVKHPRDAKARNP